MPLPLPDLDTRRWADLVEEARALIPRYAPGWTDHNVHDPGIMLAELLAAVTERDVYRANRVPLRHRSKFLRLLGYQPRPPVAATGYLAFRLDPLASPLVFPAGTLLSGPDEAEVRTVASLTVSAARLPIVQGFDGTGFTDLSRRLRDGLDVHPWGMDPADTGGAGPGSATAPPAGGQPDEAPALYLGLDCSPPAGMELSLWAAVVAPAGERDRLPECRRPAHHSIRTLWEFWDGSAWQPVDTLADETRGLTLPGAVRLGLLAEIEPRPLGVVPASGHYLRCRLAVGRPDDAPVLRDIAVHAVAVEQAKPVADVPVGVGTGAPFQRFPLPDGAVAGGVVTVRSREDGAAYEWRQRSDLDASTRVDRDFTVEPGMVGFGDGERGAVVPAGAELLAGYLATQGAAGNLAGGRSWTLLGPPPGPGLLDVTNPLPLSGGADAETPEHATGRAAETLWAHERIADLADLADLAAGTLDQLDRADVLSRRAPERATTVLDTERILLDLPGARVARVRAWADRDPRYPEMKAPGAVTVVLLPYLPSAAPHPTAGLLAEAQAYLEDRRVICTRPVVVGPSYLTVSVAARVALRGGADAQRVADAVTQALDRFFHPLSGGSAGRGWPFGRDVYRTEVLQVIAATPGVDHVGQLSLLGPDGQEHCGNLCVPETWLIRSGEHRIETEGGAI